MIEVSEQYVERLAKIMGGLSGAALALTTAEHRRAAGEIVTFYQVKGSIHVQGRPARSPLGEGEGK